MTPAQLLQILGLVDAAVAMWREHGQDEAELFALREQMAEMSAEEKLSVLQARSDALQGRADELRER